MKIVISESQLKFIIENETSESILIVGDSHSVNNGSTYGSLLKKSFDNVDIISEGGKSTSWMKEELKKKLEEKKYDKVIIFGGNNDISSENTINSAYSNIQDMVNMVNFIGGKPYVISGFFPINLDDTNLDKVYKTDAFKRYDDFQKNLPIKINSSQIIPQLKMESSSLSNFHLNSNGHKLFFDYVKPFLESSVSTKSEPKISSGIFEKFGDLGVLLVSLFNMLSKSFGFDNIIELNGEVVPDLSTKQIQESLKFLNFYDEQDYSPDGKFDEETENAIKNFQKENNLTQDGVMDKNDIEKLIELLSKKNFTGFDLKKYTSLNKKNPNKNDFSCLKNPNPYPFPSNMGDKLKEIVGEEDYQNFVRGCESIGLPLETALRQLYTESIGFNKDVVSCKRDSPVGLGLAQFMTDSWKAWGEGPCTSTNTEGGCCDPKLAIKAYVKFMGYLIKRFPGRLNIAVGGYNSGPNLKIYDKALADETPWAEINTKHQGVGRIPSETINYVSKILQC